MHNRGSPPILAQFRFPSRSWTWLLERRWSEGCTRAGQRATATDASTDRRLSFEKAFKLKGVVNKYNFFCVRPAALPVVQAAEAAVEQKQEVLFTQLNFEPSTLTIMHSPVSHQRENCMGSIEASPVLLYTHFDV